MGPPGSVFCLLTNQWRFQNPNHINRYAGITHRMHRLTRALTVLNSVESHFLNPPSSILATASATIATIETTAPPFRALSTQIRSVATESPTKNTPVSAFRRRGMDSSSPAGTAGIDDFVHVGDDPHGNSDNSHEGSVESVLNESLRENSAGDGEAEGNSYKYERKVLPEELSRSVVALTCESVADGGVCDVYLVGTAHVSAESCQEVQDVINFLKPQVVFLELCSSRVAVLTPQNLKIPTLGEMMEMWKKNHNLFGILYSWFLAKVASKLEVLPGAEFRVAYEEAMKYDGKVILGDRPVQITLRRTWAKMPLWHKTKLLYSILFQAFFLPSPADLNKMLKEMDNVDMLTLVIQEMSKQFPTLMETLVHERDQYMSTSLLRVAREHNSVVAVVGKGHLPGIQKTWQQPVDVKQLLSIPSSQNHAIPVKKIITTIGVTVAGVAILSGLYLSTKK